MNTLDFIVKDWKLDLSQPSPIYVKRSRQWSLPRLYRDLGFMVGAEIGVERGLYSEIMLKVNPNLKLYLVDLWAQYPGYPDESDEKQIQHYREAKENLKTYNVEYVRDYSMDAVKRFEDESLDFVYIDAAHDYAHVYEDIREWSKKVKHGGIIAGHDYGNNKKPSKGGYGVVPAVDQWVKENNIHPLILLKKNTIKSWMYVKV